MLRPLRTTSARGTVLMLGAMLCFASMDTLSKYIVHRYGVAEVLFVRSVVYLGFAVLVCQRGGGFLRALRTPRPALQFFRSALAVAENATFILAFSFLPLADAHSLGSTSPLIVVALSAPLLGEKVGLPRWAAVGTGFLGVLLIVRPGFATPDFHLLIPLAGAAEWGLYQILLRLCSRTDSDHTTLAWSAWVSLALTAGMGLPGWIAPTPGGWIALGAIGVLGSCAHYALIKALAYAPAASLQPYSYSLLIFVTLLGMAVFGDVPDLWTVLGGVVVVGSGLYAWWQERGRSPC